MLTKNTDQLRRVVAEHIAQDAVVQGIYWDKITLHGCFIGCLAHGNKPELNEEQYGLPVMLQRIAEHIFEALSADEAKEFFNALPDAVGCDGKDLTKVSWQFLASELRALPEPKTDIEAVIDLVIVGIECLAVGKEWREVTAATEAAKAAVWSAADVEGATLAAWSAAEAANPASAAAMAAARAINAADWTVAAASAHAWAAGFFPLKAALAARRRQRDLLLRLITEAPVVEQMQELEEPSDD